LCNDLIPVVPPLSNFGQAISAELTAGFVQKISESSFGLKLSAGMEEGEATSCHPKVTVRVLGKFAGAIHPAVGGGKPILLLLSNSC
jgi:hypothetical protein